MKTIEAIATINANGQIQLNQPKNLPIGTFKIVLIIDDSINLEDLEDIEILSTGQKA